MKLLSNLPFVFLCALRASARQNVFKEIEREIFSRRGAEAAEKNIIESTIRLLILNFSTLVLAGALALLAGCERKAPTDAAPKTAAAPQESAAPKPPSDSPPDMVRISGGHFTMGDKTEVDAAPHEVKVSSFYMDKFLVTQEQYQKVVGSNPSQWKNAKNPVEQVRWSDAVKFCNQRSQLENLQPCYDLKTWKCDFAANGYRLPTEAEWEYACRAGSSTAYFFGDSPSKLGQFAWFDQDAGGRPRPVGQKLPNAWGLYDICGDVWEWCNDFYKVDYYQESPARDPKGPDTSQTKAVRGGAWRFGAESCRSGYRYNENPGYADVCFGYDIYGFRCVRAAPDQVAGGAGGH